MIYGTSDVVELPIKHEAKPSALCRQRDHNPRVISHVKHDLPTLNGLKFVLWVFQLVALESSFSFAL